MARDPIERWPKHSEIAQWVTELVIDLQLHLAGIKPNAPITRKRLDEWADYYAAKLEKCTEHVGLKH